MDVLWDFRIRKIFIIGQQGNYWQNLARKQLLVSKAIIIFIMLVLFHLEKIWFLLENIYKDDLILAFNNFRLETPNG